MDDLGFMMNDDNDDDPDDYKRVNRGKEMQRDG